MPMKMQPVPKIKEQEHSVCAVADAPKPGMAKIAISIAIETPACDSRLSEKVFLFALLTWTYQGDLISSLTAEVIDKLLNFYTINNTINRCISDAFNCNQHAQYRSCSIAHERKKFIPSMSLCHSMHLDETSFGLVMMVLILGVAYVVKGQQFCWDAEQCWVNAA
jgi:hypothetical protein